MVGGLAGLADAGWLRLFPGVGASVPLLAGAATAVCLAVVLPAALSRPGRLGAQLAALPPVLPLGLALLLAPPTEGRGLLRLGWTAALLLLAWRQSRDLIRDAGLRGPGPTTTAVVLGGLAVTGGIRVVADRAAAAPTGAMGIAMAGLVAGAALSWVAMVRRGEVVRSALAAGARVDRGFRREWWFAVPAAIAISLLPGAVVPPYPAPLRGAGLGHLVVRFIEATAGRSPRPPMSPTLAAAARQAAGLTGVWLAAACLLVLILVWPARGLMERLLDRLTGMTSLPPTQRTPWRQRLLGWWLTVHEWWRGRHRPRGTPGGGGRWRLAVPAIAKRSETRAERGLPLAPQGDRARVRAAYARFLQAARAAGLARVPAHTPRRFLAWMGARAAPVRFPLETLTQRYERARYAEGALAPGESEAAEREAAVAAYVLDVAQAQRRRAGESPAAAGLRWTAPRGVEALRRRNRPGS